MYLAMRNQRVFIHVGLPKTASTLLQEFVFPELRDTTYISRPYTQENHAFNKLQYADDSLYAAEELRSEIERIISLETGRNILISDELLSGAPFYNFINRGLIAKRLAAILPDAEVILFIRGQKDIIRSLYNQYVKIGWFTDALNSRFISVPGSGFELSDFIKGRRDWNIDNRFISHQSFMNQHHFLFFELVKLYEDNFRKVHLFLYEDLSTRPEMVLSRLEELFETQFPSKLLETIRTTNVNAKLSDDELLAQFNHSRSKSASSHRWENRIGTAFGRLVALKGKDKGFVERREKHLAQIVDAKLFGENNSKLANKYPHVEIRKYPECYCLD
jgi:Sulfotransferase domain